MADEYTVAAFRLIRIGPQRSLRRVLVVRTHSYAFMVRWLHRTRHYRTRARKMVWIEEEIRPAVHVAVTPRWGSAGVETIRTWEPGHYWTVAQLCFLLKRSESLVRELVKDIEGVKLDRKIWLVPQSAIDEIFVRLQEWEQAVIDRRVERWRKFYEGRK